MYFLTLNKRVKGKENFSVDRHFFSFKNLWFQGGITTEENVV